ncbi:MAG: phosphatase PAP2 family protein [Caulobacteraceae bacterium]
MRTLVAVFGVALAIGALPSSAPAAPVRKAPTAKAVVSPAGGAMAASAKAATQGYLSPSRLPDAIHLIGPPPPEGSGTKTGDVATYENTRLMQGSERWVLAAHDAVFGADAMMQDLSCALGVELTAARAPVLHHLLERMVFDADGAGEAAKRYYRRPRPFVENGGPICVEAEDWLRRSYSYPSGHSTYSWTVALALAEIAPDRAEQVLARARAYAESRVVCGVHYQSDIQAGRVTATAVYAALQANAAFRHDLARARLELRRQRVRPAPAPPEECRIEAQAEATPIW